MLTKLTARARTRGKAPVEFTYEGYGESLAERTIKGKAGEFVVDDIVIPNLSEDDLSEVLGIFDGDFGKLLKSAVARLNDTLRAEAAPVSEVKTEDAFTAFLAACVEHGIIVGTEEKSVEGQCGTWRRNITTSAQMFEIPKREAALKSREAKALRKAGVDVEALIPEEESAE